MTQTNIYPLIDQPSMDKINKLHPKIREEVKKIVQEINTRLKGKAKVRIAQGLRSFEEQNKLYAQGRTTKGAIVTKAKGGQSNHNYGFSVDIVLIINGKEASWDTKTDWDNDKKSDWTECVEVFKEFGWSWGGDWSKFKDMPHFDKKGFDNWRVMINMKRDKEGYIIV